MPAQPTVAVILPQFGTNPGQNSSASSVNTAEYAVIVPYTNPPPMIDMTDAAGCITWACANAIGSANPVTAMHDVINRPKSRIGDVVSYSGENSEALAHDPASALGSGASMNDKAVVNTRQKWRDRNESNVSEITVGQKQ